MIFEGIVTWGHYWGPMPQWRIEELLATRRVAPSNREWQARVVTMQLVKFHAIPALEKMLSSEIKAMFADRDRMGRQTWERREAYSKEDEKAALSCEMRAEAVRGASRRDATRRRVCFLCAKEPLPPRRQSWCSDDCVQRWMENHEWTTARNAALRRDHGKCVRDPAHRGSVEVNHIVPRYGRGYHAGCHNHLSNLETLCHGCHLEVTADQRRDRPLDVHGSGPGADLRRAGDPAGREHHEVVALGEGRPEQLGLEGMDATGLP